MIQWRADATGMSATTGYFVAGSSWLHRRNPLTKLLALGLVLLAAFLLPPIVLPVLRRDRRRRWLVGRPASADGPGDADPGRAAHLDRRRQRSLLPGREGHLVSIGPLSITREGLTFGLISAGRVLVAFLASVAFLFTTLADDLLEALISRGASHRIAFVVLSAVQMVPADAGACRRDPRGPAGARPDGRRGRSCAGCGRSCRSSGRSCSGRSSTSASARSRSRPAGSARGRVGRPIGSSPTRRSIDGCGCSSWLGIVASSCRGRGHRR